MKLSTINSRGMAKPIMFDLPNLFISVWSMKLDAGTHRVLLHQLTPLKRVK